MLVTCTTCEKPTMYNPYGKQGFESCKCGRLKIYDYEIYKQLKTKSNG